MLGEDFTNVNDLFDESYEIKRRKEFSQREVGLNHPDNSSFMRLADDGSIEIFACPGVGIIINPSTRSISFFADTIKMYCKEDDGLRWNNMSFNPASDMYNEPALIKTNTFANNPAYHNSVLYLNNLQDLEDNTVSVPVTIQGEYGLSGVQGMNSVNPQSSGSNEPVIPENVQSLIRSFAQTNSDNDVQKLVEYIKNGYSFSQALEKIQTSDQNLPEDMENFPWIRNDIE